MFSVVPLIPYFQNLDLKDDTYRCNARAWIEARFSDDVTGVVDSSCNVFSIPSPEIGQQSREEYAKAHIENPVGDLADGVDGGMWHGGDCCKWKHISSRDTAFCITLLKHYIIVRFHASKDARPQLGQLGQIRTLVLFSLDSLSLIYHKTGRAPTDLARIDCNNSFSTLQTGEEPRAPTQSNIARVGVYDMIGITEPRSGPFPAPFVPIPPGMRSSVEDLISTGKNPNFQALDFNDASLKSINIVPILLQTTTLQADSAMSDSIKVAKGVAQAVYVLSSMPITSTEIGKLVTNLCAGENGTRPIREGLAAVLRGLPTVDF